MVRGSILLLLFVALLGCQPESDSIRIGSNRWLGYAPIYLADDLGWTAPVASVWWNTRTPQVCCAAFATACWTPPCSPSTKRCCCRTARRSSTRDHSGHQRLSWRRCAVRPRAADQSQDTAGQRIGVENTALGAYFLSRVLDQAGLRIDDLQVVSLPVHEQAAAFAAGEVDAVITFASEGPALESKGARRIFDSRQLPGEIVDVLVVDRQRVTREQRRRLRALWFDALRTAGQSRRNRSAPACAPGPDADGTAGHPRRPVDG